MLSHCMQVYYSGESWTSIGFSEDGMMIGSDAVIGLPDDETALEYNLTLQVRLTGMRHIPPPLAHLGRIAFIHFGVSQK